MAKDRGRPISTDEVGELRLLAEFIRNHSVASLASEIAARLGQPARSDDLIAEAEVGSTATPKRESEAGRTRTP
jgi:hypothetical protein